MIWFIYPLFHVCHLCHLCHLYNLFNYLWKKICPIIFTLYIQLINKYKFKISNSYKRIKINFKFVRININKNNLINNVSKLLFVIKLIDWFLISIVILRFKILFIKYHHLNLLLLFFSFLIILFLKVISPIINILFRFISLKITLWHFNLFNFELFYLFWWILICW
jgi:hypothetical protein